MAVPETTGVKNAGGITRFMRETKVELKKVTWPTKQELIANTACGFDCGCYLCSIDLGH